MYRYLLLLLFFCAAQLCVSGQEEDIVDGYNVFYYPNGKKLSEGNIRNGKPDGYWKTFYTTGIVKSEGNRKNYQLDSVWIFYNSIGDTINKINYLNGRKNGYYYEYYTNRSQAEYVGNIKSKELYIDDIKVGESYYYFGNGNLREKSNYVNGVLDGLSVEYAEDERIISIKRFSKGTLVEMQKINRFNRKGQKSGEWLEFYEGIKVKRESNFKDDVLHGYYKEYNKQGKLMLTLLYDNGKLVEKFKENEKKVVVKEVKEVNGNTTTGPYIDNIPVGIHKTIDKEGEIVGSKIYSDFGELLSEGIIDREGKKKGEWKDYFTNGTIRAAGQYSNNRREGKWVFYYVNGRIEQEGKYKNGLEHGEWKRYYDNGNLFVEENYYNGREDGLYFEYDIDGNIIAEGEFIDGEKEGEWIVNINDFKGVGKYITGLRDGRWRYYYDNGNVLFEGNYIQGNAEGKHKYFYSNGVLKEEQIYSSGMPVKHWKKFDSFGNLIITISYKDGKEYRINGVKIDFPPENKVVIK